MVTFTINIPQMLAYIPYMDPMGYEHGETLHHCFVMGGFRTLGTSLLPMAELPGRVSLTPKFWDRTVPSCGGLVGGQVMTGTEQVS